MTSHIQQRPNPNAVKTNFGWVDKNTGELLVSLPGGFKEQNEAIMERPNIRGPVKLLQEVPFQPTSGISIEEPEPVVIIPREPVMLDNFDTFTPTGPQREPESGMQVATMSTFNLNLALASEKDVHSKAGPIHLSGVEDGTKVTISDERFKGEIIEDGNFYIKVGKRDLEHIYGRYDLTVSVGNVEFKLNLYVHNREEVPPVDAPDTIIPVAPDTAIPISIDLPEPSIVIEEELPIAE